MACCAAPVIASYFTFYVIKPQGRAYGELITPTVDVPADLALRLDLEAVLLLGPVASGDRAGRATVWAECCEALVGAIFEGWGADAGGLMAVHTWLDPHWRQDSAELLADPLRHNWKSALQEWSQGLGLGLPSYTCQEISRVHGDPRRFHATVQVSGRDPAEGWGGSRREAEQQAARAALAMLGVSGAPPQA